MNGTITAYKQMDWQNNPALVCLMPDPKQDKVIADAQQYAGKKPINYLVLIHILNHFLALHDPDHKGHSERVACLAARFGAWVGLTESDIEIIRRAGWMHDLGKLGVPDGILQKRGPLDENEWALMRKHPEYSYLLFDGILFVDKSRMIAYCHHENWDGSGYPRGIKGEEIPFLSRILSLADVWDALISIRSYKKAWAYADVCDYIHAKAGTQFDPHLAPIFLKMLNQPVSIPE